MDERQARKLIDGLRTRAEYWAGDRRTNRAADEYSVDVPNVCAALEAALEREANWKALYVSACDSYLGLGAGAEEEAEKHYRAVYGQVDKEDA